MQPFAFGETIPFSSSTNYPLQLEGMAAPVTFPLHDPTALKVLILCVKQWLIWGGACRPTLLQRGRTTKSKSRGSYLRLRSQWPPDGMTS